MDVKIGIRYYPRKVETIHESIKSSGIKPTIYPDGVDFQLEGYEVRQLGENVGCFKHYYRVLQDLCNSDADVVGTFSDDILYYDNWLDIALEKLNDKKTGFVSCYVPRGVKHRYNWKIGWHLFNKGWAKTWGGGYLFRRETAIKMLEHPYLIKHRDKYEANQQIDHAIPETMMRMKLNQWYYVPSLMNHIGYTSTIGHKHSLADIGAGWPIRG